MAQPNSDSLLQAIKNDDRKAFDALMQKAQCGSYRLGRFPVLSLLYLYGARKILAVYEKDFLKITDYRVLREPVEISRKFSQRAGKCLRLYFDQAVSPLEMLMIIDRTGKLKRVYPQVKPNEQIKRRLQSIYSIKYALGVRFEGDNIIPDRRPLLRREKNILIAVCACLILLVSVPVTVAAATYQPARGISNINFASINVYTLESDIILPKNYKIEKVNCKIIGNGHKIVLREGASLGTLNGTLSSVTVESTGDAVFDTVSVGATVENVTVNVSVNKKVRQSGAFVALNNYGTLDGVVVNVSGALTALSPSGEKVNFVFGGAVLNNTYTQTVTGIIKNCSVHYDDFELNGETGADAAFGGLVGTNGGRVEDCTVDGAIRADTVDLAGVCSANGGLLTRTVNRADLSQTSDQTQWNPIACGIVLNNAGVVEDCENSGRISAVSTCGRHETQAGDNAVVSAAGIAYINDTTMQTAIRRCANLGDISSRAAYRNAYAAGVCLSSGNAIEYCKNSGSLTAQADNGYGTYVGGITSLAYGYIYKSVNEGDITSTGSGMTYVGGISACLRAQALNCVSDGNISVTANGVCAGGIFGLGEINNYGSGIADYCISRNKLDVWILGDLKSYVGGIAGCVSQAAFRNNDDSIVYLGGGVTYSYFLGECVSFVSDFGNIVGAVGADIYAGNANTMYNTPNFTDNFYLANDLPAIGTTVTTGGDSVPADDKGATAAPLTEIQESEVYQTILTALNE